MKEYNVCILQKKEQSVSEIFPAKVDRILETVVFKGEHSLFSEKYMKERCLVLTIEGG